MPAIVDRVALLDRKAMRLCAERARKTRSLVRVASSIVQRQTWVQHGDSRLADFARERLGRSGRWLLDLASLEDALVAHPPLAAALCGADGGIPIGRVAARWIGRVADRGSLTTWIRVARHLSVHELRNAITRAAARGGVASPTLLDPEENWVRIAIPATVRAAFDETFDLHRRISGIETSLASFVEALLAESGCCSDDLKYPESVLDRDQARQPGALPEPRRDACRCTPQPPPGEFEPIVMLAVDGDTDLLAAMRQLIESEDYIELELGLLLEAMDAQAAWPQLGYRSLSHYGESRLGLARTTVQNRVTLARSRRRFPRLYDAYASGKLGFEAALLVLRILRSGGCREAVAQAWIERAQQVTIKRLRDELRLVQRTYSSGASGGLRASVPSPPSDAQWHASLGREPGHSLREVRRLGEMTAKLVADSLRFGGAVPQSCTDVFLNLRLPVPVAADLWAALQKTPMARIDRGPSSAIATHWWRRGLAPPVWVTLLHMLEEFAMTWDDPRAAPRRAADAVYIRDGWRCSAPGCTARANLEDHHLVYRSAGGSNALSNRIVVCRFHHRMGEHGGLASCRGVAPLDVRWRLGKAGSATRFFNERRVQSCPEGAAPQLLGDRVAAVGVC